MDTDSNQQCMLDLPEQQLPPYMARQQAMRKIAARTLREEAPGLYMLGSVTGSGKNYCVEQEVIEALVEGLNGTGPLGKGSKRKWIVFVTPGKENRDRFVENVRRGVATRLGRPDADEIAQSHVLNLRSNTDCLSSWLLKNGILDGEGAPLPCPFLPIDAEEGKELARAWNEAVNRFRRWLGDEAHLENDDEMKSEVWKKVNERERALRKSVAKANRDGYLAHQDIVREVWPAAALDPETPCVIAMTSNKMMYPVDTVFAGTLWFYGTEVADRSCFIFDEIDQVKADWLSAIIEGCGEYQPDVMVRDLYHRLCIEESLADPLVLGNYASWLRMLNEARNVSRHAGSRASKNQISKQWFAKQVGDIERSAKDVQRIIRRCYKELHLQYAFDYSEDIKQQGLKDRELFSLDDIALDMGESGRFRYVPVEKADRNIIGANAEEGQWLGQMMRRCRGAIRRALRHFARCVRLMDELFKGEMSFDTERSVAEVVDALGARNAQTKEAAFWRQAIALHMNIVRGNALGKTEDATLYAKGVEFAKISAKQGVQMTRDLSIMGFETMPETYLAQIAKHAPCLCMSATWNVPSVTVFAWDYLDEIKGVIRKPEWLTSGMAHITQETELLNRELRKSYDVQVTQVPSDAILKSWKGGQAATVQCIDAIEAKTLEAFLEIGGSEEFARKALDKLRRCDLKDAKGFALERFSRILKAVGAWADGVARCEHFAGVIFTPRDYSSAKTNSLDKAMLDIATMLVEDKRGRGFFKATVDESPADALAFVNAKTWKDNWEEGAKQRLSCGKPTLAFINFKAGGFSKNLQYPVPTCLDGMVRRLNLGFEGDDGHEVDIDFMYIESPTSRIVSSCEQLDDESPVETKWMSDLIKGVAQQEELAERGELSPKIKIRNIKKLMHGEGNIGIKGTLSHDAEGARIVAQAAGRACRANWKMPTLTIALDPNVATTCDFSFFKDLPVAYELEAIMGSCGATAAHERKPRHTVESMERNVALVRNRAASKRHSKLLSALFAADAQEADRERFDDERRFVLSHAIADRDDFDADPNRLTVMLRTRFATAGYAYALNANGYAVDIELPVCAGDSIEQMKERLSQRQGKNNLRIAEVSQEAARFGELMDIPEVKAHWIRNGWPVEPFAPGNILLCPDIFQMVYLGVLGEEAGRAIFESYFRGVYSLSRGQAAKAERGGDYVVLDARGNETGVWIDFKHYRMNAFANLGFAARDQSDALRFEGKANEVGAKRLLVVNVLSDETSRQMSPAPLGTEGIVCSIPHMAHEGRVDDRMMEAIRDVIESR